MAAVAGEKNMLTGRVPDTRGQVPGHVPGCFDDPKAAVAKIVHSFIKGAPRDPGSLKFSTRLGLYVRVGTEEP